MEFESYADVIDSFERDDMGYASLTDYINGENIKIKEIEMDVMGDLKKALSSKKDGGLMVAIQKFANGGGIGSMMQPKSKTGKAINQLQSKAPEGEFLAYINPDEAAMLKRAGGSGEPVNGIPSFRPQDMGNKSNQKSSASRTSSSSKSSSKGTGGSKGNLGGGGGGQGTTYRSYRAPTKPTYTAKTIDSKPVTGNDYRDSRNDFVNTLNKNNQIAAERGGPRFTPYQGGARTSSYYNPNPLSGLLKLAAGFAFPGASFFLNKGSKLKDGIMNLNDSIQNSDFGRSTSFADYRDIKSFGGYDEREMAKQINKDEAKNLQARIDGGEFGGFERPTQTFTFDNSKMKPPAEVKGLDTSFYENENSIGMGSAPTGVMKPGGFTNTLYDGRYAPVPNNSTQPQEFVSKNPIGGVDQFAKEMEALEKRADGAIMPVSNMGGTLQDFYTNRNPGTNANTMMQVYDDNINFNQPQEFISNNPIGGVDQFAKEMEALEANLPMGVNRRMTSNQMGGTLQDFYTNKNLTGASTGGVPSNANSMFEVFNDNINFNDQASLPANNMVAEITQADINRFKQPMTQMMDFDTYKSINTDSTLTPQEFEQLKAQV